MDPLILNDVYYLVLLENAELAQVQAQTGVGMALLLHPAKQHGLSMETTPRTDLTRMATPEHTTMGRDQLFFSFWKRETIWEKDDFM